MVPEKEFITENPLLHQQEQKGGKVKKWEKVVEVIALTLVSTFMLTIAFIAYKIGMVR